MNDDRINLIPTYLKNSEIINVIATDMQGYFTYVNSCFQKRFSFISEDLIGVNSMETIHDQDHQACIDAVQQCIANHSKPVRVELRKCTDAKDNFEWTEWEFSIVFNEVGLPVGILCVGYSITQEKNLKEKLSNKKDVLERVAQTQAHQLRGPLTSLQMVLDMMNRKEGVYEKKELELLGEAILKVDESILQIIDLTVERSENKLKSETR